MQVIENIALTDNFYYIIWVIRQLALITIYSRAEETARHKFKEGLLTKKYSFSTFYVQNGYKILCKQYVVCSTGMSRILLNIDFFFLLSMSINKQKYA